jgi:hypothetical protein
VAGCRQILRKRSLGTLIDKTGKTRPTGIGALRPGIGALRRPGSSVRPNQADVGDRGV